MAGRVMDGIQDIYELSPMQHGMLFDSVTEGDSGMYLIQLEYALRGELRAEDLEEAWRRAAARHAVLRTSFHWDGMQKPQQVVHAEAPLTLAVHDWREIAPEEQERRFAEHRREDRARGVDFEQPPLMRLALFRMGPDSHRLLWTVHHILVEGWSASLILEDVLAVYRSLRAGNGAAGPALPERRPYRDYISWIQQQDPARAEAHWREELRGLRDVTVLGIDHAPADAQGAVTEYDEREMSLSPEASRALQELARGNRLTLNTVVQGAWAVLLSRYADTEDVVFGTIVSGRSVPVEGIEAMVGLFINLMPARARVPGAQPLSSWLRDLQTRQASQRAYEHVPLVDIKRWSEVGAGMPLFESLLVFENWAGDLTSAQWDTDLQVTGVRGYHGSPGHPVMAVVVPGPRLSVRLTYDRRRFRADAVDRLLANLEALLVAFPQDPERRLADLPFPSPVESARLDELNRSAVTDPGADPVPRRIAALAAQHPGRPAVTDRDRTLTYGELVERAGRIAGALARRGVGRGDRVAVCLERGSDLVAALLAVLRRGAAYVPLDPAYPAARIRFIRDHSSPAVTLTGRAVAAQLFEQEDASVLLLDGDESFDAAADGAPGGGITGDDPAYVIYTSGSTGEPKGVSVPHRALTNFLESMRAEPGLAADDVLVAVTTLSFDIAGLELWLPLTTGAHVVIAGREDVVDGERLAAMLEESGATVMQATPATWRLLLDSGWTGRPGLKALCGGEALPPELAAALRPRCHELWNLYGPTETTIWSTTRRVDDDGPVTVGGPIAATQIHVLDGRLRRVPLGVAGEVYIGGDGVAHGYFRRADLTAERFLPDPFGGRAGARLYRTGDIGRRLPDGDVQILGRTDHQVKVRGFRIELGEIEATLARHPSVHEAVALAREDSPGDVRLVAYVVGANGAAPAAGELRRHAAEALPDYMVPAAWVTLDKMPRTPNGKVDRRALPAPDGARADLGAGFVAPRTPVEETVAEIWQSVLEVDRVGVRDNFFDLGGHSLLLMPVIDQLKKRLGVKLRPGELVLPTLGQLAALCEERLSEQGGKESGGGLFGQIFRAIRSTVTPGNPPE
jgi:amino acid adenylation domain-containing protein